MLLRAGSYLVLLALAGCFGPEPSDAQRRQRANADQIATWNQETGDRLDPDDPMVDAWLRRHPDAALDPLAHLVAARGVLDGVPDLGLQSLDLAFDSLSPLLAGASVLLIPPAVVGVGRSSVATDADPLVGGPFRTRRGVLIGGERWKGGTATSLEALGAELDRDPPSLVLTLAAQDATGGVWIQLKRKEGAWWTLSTSNAEIGARLLLASTAVSDEGASVASSRYGRGIWPKTSAPSR